MPTLTFMEKIRAKAIRARDAWLENNSEQQIANRVKEILDEQVETIIAGVMGFKKDTFGHGWELKSWNEGTPTSKAVEEAANRIAVQWLKEHEDELVKIMDKHVKLVHKEFDEQLRYEISSAAQQLASSKAYEIAEQALSMTPKKRKEALDKVSDDELLDELKERGLSSE